MRQYSFEKLEVWRLSKDFVLKIYKLIENFPASEKYGLVDQLKRAAVSVPTNLAESSGRQTGKDKAYFTQLAYGSLMECLNLLIFSQELGFISLKDHEALREYIEIITQKLSNYRRSQLSKTTKPLNS